MYHWLTFDLTSGQTEHDIKRWHHIHAELQPNLTPLFPSTVPRISKNFLNRVGNRILMRSHGMQLSMRILPYLVQKGPGYRPRTVMLWKWLWISGGTRWLQSPSFSILRPCSPSQGRQRRSQPRDRPWTFSNPPSIQATHKRRVGEERVCRSSTILHPHAHKDKPWFAINCKPGRVF